MKLEIKWAILLGIITLLWFLLESITGLNDEFIGLHKLAGMFYLVPFTLVYVFALMQKKNLELGGDMNFFQGLKTAALIAIFSIPLMVIAAYININYISTDFLDNMIDYLITTGEDMVDLKKAFSPSGYLIATVWYALSGIIFGGVAALIVKNK